MIKKKLYKCDICSREVPIRSTIRNNEKYKGKKCCGFCKQKHDKVVDDSKKKFFDDNIALLKIMPKCENCHCDIDASFMPASNVAHILAKSKYKSVAWEPNNRVFLCAGKNEKESNNCHHLFDSNISGRKEMEVYEIAKQRFERFKHKVKERGNEFEIFE